MPFSGVIKMNCAPGNTRPPLAKYQMSLYEAVLLSKTIQSFPPKEAVLLLFQDRKSILPFYDFFRTHILNNPSKGRHSSSKTAYNFIPGFFFPEFSAIPHSVTFHYPLSAPKSLIFSMAKPVTLSDAFAIVLSSGTA